MCKVVCMRLHVYMACKAYLQHWLQTNLQRRLVPGGIGLQDRLFTIQFVFLQILVDVRFNARFQWDAVHCWLLLIGAVVNAWLHFGADKIAQSRRFFLE